ncbi:MAG: aminopeptidase P family protein [Lachnospiraceae bacterium]|nr:aminopeptidase P family protein [Lachnospiraceae bacterium]
MGMIEKQRIAELQELLKQAGIDYYIVPTADYHNSEYVNEYFKMRKFLSGFTGSAGTLVVSSKEAGLWTDGRYFVQAESQLEGSGIVLYKMSEEGVPTIKEYLEQNAVQGQTIGFDGRVVDASFGKDLEKIFEGKNVKIVCDKDIAAPLWKDRPAMPVSKVWIVPEESCGMSVHDKLARVREKMSEEGAEHLLISKLDDIMWLYNIRANDVECNPVALSYTFVSKDKAVLFLQKEALTDEATAHFEKNGVTYEDYNSIVDYLQKCEIQGKVWCAGSDISYLLYKLMENRAELVDKANPTELMKAVKNPTELAHIRKYYLDDSAVLTKFLFWMKENAGKVELDELSAAKKLNAMRAEIPGFLDLSFETISAYKSNAAMAHYSATEEHASSIGADGFYLVDSGGQYVGGTTDVTRTIALGAITDEMKMHFTKVACSMLRMADVKFLSGCTGRNLDIIARQPLWECGLDYKHGTGHGIGYILNVHEGPHSLRWQYKPEIGETVLEEGMIVSDEPGMYVQDSHGIRTENIVEVVKENKNEYGQFMGFRHLTYVPIDLDAIDVQYMEPSDIRKLNAYHKDVYTKLAPYFEGEELEKLAYATRAVAVTFI